MGWGHGKIKFAFLWLGLEKIANTVPWVQYQYFSVLFVVTAENLLWTFITEIDREPRLGFSEAPLG